MFTKIKRYTPLALSFLNILCTSSFVYSAHNKHNVYPTFRDTATTHNDPEMRAQQEALATRLTKKRTEMFITYVMNLPKEQANTFVPGFPFTRTPLEVLIYHNNTSCNYCNISLSTAQYETLLNHLLELGSDPNQCCRYILHEVACQDNYTTFKKILDTITPDRFDPNILSVMFNFSMGQNIQDTPDTQKILRDLIKRGARTDFSLSPQYHPIATKQSLHDRLSSLCQNTLEHD